MTDEVLLERDGRLGRIILNRPKALNALTHEMVTAITSALQRWATDDTVQTVVITGAGDRGLCAGGDIVGIYEDAKSGGGGTAKFWADEYALNSFIAHYPKPYVAIMDGVVLGGGVGISAHGSVRVVTERTKTGMPEVGIGFAPDVGGTFLLSRAPGELGTHLALTGGMISGADAIAVGLADHYIPSELLPAFLAALATWPVEDALRDATTETPASTLAAQREWIDASYASNDAGEIVARLEAAGHAETATVIQSKSPTSVAVTLEALRRSRQLDTLEEALDQEYRVSLRFLEGTEIVEGIRAQVIDKDRNPHWSPATLDAVSRADVEHYFASLGPRELGLSADSGRNSA